MSSRTKPEPPLTELVVLHLVHQHPHVLAVHIDEHQADAMTGVVAAHHHVVDIGERLLRNLLREQFRPRLRKAPSALARI